MITLVLVKLRQFYDTHSIENRSIRYLSVLYSSETTRLQPTHPDLKKLVFVCLVLSGLHIDFLVRKAQVTYRHGRRIMYLSNSICMLVSKEHCHGVLAVFRVKTVLKSLLSTTERKISNES